MSPVSYQAIIWNYVKPLRFNYFGSTSIVNWFRISAHEHQCFIILHLQYWEWIGDEAATKADAYLVMIRKSRDYVCALLWRHNGHDGVSNHQPQDCLLNRSFRRRLKKASKLCVTGLCVGNSPVTMMTSSDRNISALLVICAGIHRSPVNSPHKGQVILMRRLLQKSHYPNILSDILD